ncbi:MAG TPA: 6,7-dimethyl-8-ribityllumazine synthase [Phycisphaerae bacterium]|nr:6,7-dimethyl-8-ribityllumazine synthase [Phycisphaerae bacterium]HRW51750.1 6,7-dimethyl-8-ribityllumazine synthase [Phycisphaerae bacterium]
MNQTGIVGKLDGHGLRFGVIVSRFNEFITSRMLEGARDALVRHGADAGAVVNIWVPGAWELPIAAKVAAESGRYDALICIGCVIRGQTTHHTHIGGEASRGVARVSLETGVPIGFGVLTTDTLEQAIERAGAKSGNKGADAALSALEMANLLRAIRDA